MRPGRPPGGFWEPKCCANHQQSLQKWIRKRQIAASKKAKISTGKSSGKKHGNQLLKQQRSKGRSLKMLIFHWFLRRDMHVRLLHTWLKSRRTRGRRGSKTVWKIDNQQSQKSHFLMTMDKNWRRIQISSKNHLQDRFLMILAWFWGPLATPKSPKIKKKASQKNSKI